MTLVIEPGSTAKETSEIASRPRKRLLSASTRRMGALIRPAPWPPQRRRSRQLFAKPSTPPGAASTSTTSNRPVANRWKSSSRASTTWVMNTSMKAPITGPNSVPRPPSSE